MRPREAGYHAVHPLTAGIGSNTPYGSNQKNPRHVSASIIIILLFLWLQRLKDLWVKGLMNPQRHVKLIYDFVFRSDESRSTNSHHSSGYELVLLQMYLNI